MKWPWKRHTEPVQGVTPEERRQLTRLREELAQRHLRVDRLVEETEREAGYLQAEKGRNQIAARFRAAFQGR